MPVLVVAAENFDVVAVMVVAVFVTLEIVIAGGSVVTS
jgi:hypothetical protein